MEPWGLAPFKPAPDRSLFRLWRDCIYGLWSHGDWSPSNPPQTDPYFAPGEIVFMAYGAMGIGPLLNLPQTDPSFASGEIGIMAYGAMGIRTPDLLNAIEALYQLSYDPLPKPKQIAESAQCHNPLAKEIVLLAVPSPSSFHHDEPD